MFDSYELLIDGGKVRVVYFGPDVSDWRPLIANVLEVDADGGELLDTSYKLTRNGQLVREGALGIRDQKAKGQG